MIWWLIRRDPAWRFTGPVVIMFATLVGLWHFFAPHGTAAESVLLGGAFAIPLSAAIVATVAHQSDIGFQAILPVRVRQVFAAQMIAVSAVMWLPVLAGCIILFLLHDVNVLAMPLGTWSVATCAALVFHCTMMRGTTKPGWPAIALLFIAPLSKPFAMPFLAAVVCWMLCAAFIMRTWRVVPASFQFAPVAAVSASRPLPARRSRSGGRSWKTLLVTLSPASGLGYAFAFVVTALWYSPLLVFFLVIFGQNWSDVRSRVRWLLDSAVVPAVLDGRLHFAGHRIAGWRLSTGYSVNLSFPPPPPCGSQKADHYRRPDRRVVDDVESRFDGRRMEAIAMAGHSDAGGCVWLADLRYPANAGGSLPLDVFGLSYEFDRDHRDGDPADGNALHCDGPAVSPPRASMNQTDTIWQLMRRDPAWRMTHWLTPGVAVICALSHFFGPAEADGDPSIFLVLPIFGLLFAGLAAVFMQSSDTDFQSPLPITVRQIFLSRMLSMAAMMLLPMAAGVAMLNALKDPITPDLPLESWTLFVCILLGIQCFAIRRNLPQWLIIIVLPAWLFVCAVAAVGDLFQRRRRRCRGGARCVLGDYRRRRAEDVAGASTVVSGCVDGNGCGLACASRDCEQRDCEQEIRRALVEKLVSHRTADLGLGLYPGICRGLAGRFKSIYVSSAGLSMGSGGRALSLAIRASGLAEHSDLRGRAANASGHLRRLRRQYPASMDSSAGNKGAQRSVFEGIRLQNPERTSIGGILDTGALRQSSADRGSMGRDVSAARHSRHGLRYL